MIESRPRADGTTAHRVRRRVRGRLEDFGTYETREEAEDANAQARFLARSGKLDAILRGNIRVDIYVADTWWPGYAQTELGTRTLRRYREVWNNHLRDRMSRYLIREMTPAVAEDMKSRLLKTAGVRTTQMALFLMQAVMRYAIIDGEYTIGSNPFKEIRKPKSKATEAVVPLTPLQVEQIRAYFLTAEDIESATLVSLLAYEFLRPEEAQALMPIKERGDVLVIDRAVEPEADYNEEERTKHRGHLGRTRLAETKTRRNRTVTTSLPVRADLAALKLARGGINARELFFARADGKPWWTTDYNNWRNRQWRAALAAAKLPKATRPYDLRHTGISLRLREGWAPSRVAKEAGHSTATMHRVYEHEIEALRGQPIMPMDDLIRAARAEITGKSTTSAAKPV
ncbi:MAG: tyrosine-type recombinase/integrase [Gaiellaceae bacterium]|jgi:hypothetical protein